MNNTDPRVTRLVLFLNSYTQGMSGGDMRFIEVAKRINGFDKIVITSLLGKKACLERGLNADYYVTTKEEHFERILFTYVMRIVKALFLKINIKDGDIPYSTSDFLPDIVPAFSYKLRNKHVKWVATINLILPYLFRDYGETLLRNRFSFPSINRAIYYFGQIVSLFLMKHFSDVILVLNKLDRNYLIKAKGIDPRKIIVVSGGVYCKQIQEIAGKKSNKYDAVFMGRFHSQKGLFDLIKIWQLVCKKKPDAKLALIGSGSKKFVEKVRTEIEINGLTNNIDMLGFIDDKDKFAVLRSSRIFLFPSRYESWGIVVVEAMACGLPVIAWDLPVYREIFPKGVVRISLGKTTDFASKTLELLGNRELLAKLRKEAKEVASMYDWDIVVKKDLEILKSLQNDIHN